MNQEYPQVPPPEELPFLQPLPRMTVIERYNISPFVFALFSIVGVFILYQVIGGLLTVIIFGLKPIPDQTPGIRIATGLGEIIFIFIPTLLLVRFVTFTPGDYLRLKFPDIRLIGLALIGILSLQQILQIMMVFQDKIPIPPSIERFLEPLKKMIEEMYTMLVSSHSLSELMLVLFIVAVIPAVAEEFLFRGLVQRCFETVLGSWKGVILTGVIFGAYHLNPFSFIPLALLGVYLGFLTMQAGSIWVSVGAHFFNNATACIALYLNMDEDAVITGNLPDMSLIEIAITIVFLIAVFSLSTYLFLKLTKKPPPPPTSFPTEQIGVG